MECRWTGHYHYPLAIQIRTGIMIIPKILILNLISAHSVYYIHTCTVGCVDLENFGVKKFCKAQTSTKLKRTRFFTMTIFTFE